MLEDKPGNSKEEVAIFLLTEREMLSKKLEYMGNNSTRLKGKKNFNLTISKFRVQR